MPELIDTYSPDGTYLGPLEREEAHRQGLWHRNFNCWVFHWDKEPRLVLQNRKGLELFDATATGHLSAGETMRDAVRELEEEIGLEAQFEDLIDIGTRKSTYDDLEKGTYNREFVSTFLYPTNLSLKDFKLQEAEVLGVAEIKTADLKMLFEGQVDFVSVTYRGADSIQPFRKEIGTQHFIERSNEYYLNLVRIVEAISGNEDFGHLSLPDC
jgi:isopentenyldiphosphate isomerase